MTIIRNRGLYISHPFVNSDNMAIKVKFSKEEEERIRKYAESYGITPSEAVECAILKECQSPEDKEFYKKIEELKKKDSVSKAISFKDYLANSEAEDKAMKAGNLRSEKKPNSE